MSWWKGIWEQNVKRSVLSLSFSIFIYLFQNASHYKDIVMCLYPHFPGLKLPVLTVLNV